MTFISGANLSITALHQVTENLLISYCQEVLPMNKTMVNCIIYLSLIHSICPVSELWKHDNVQYGLEYVAEMFII